MISLGVNIDHVATLRQARYREDPASPHAEPDPVEAARAAERAGAHGITVHLRADRRHMQDADLPLLQAAISTKLNLEMGLTDEILGIALQLRPHDVCLVPEGRQEVTTEGGLDCVAFEKDLGPAMAKLQSAGIRVSLFIDPDPQQIETAARLRAQFVELHTGAYANAVDPAVRASEVSRLHDGAALAGALGLRVNAGHGLNYKNLSPILALPHLEELNIGHSIVSRAMVVGMEEAVREMLSLIGAA